MIYRFSLVAEDEIEVTKSTGIPEPGLLSVNKIVRAETIGLFYQGNRFLCRISYHDNAVLRLIAQKSRYIRNHQDAGPNISNAMVTLPLNERNWTNLATWLQDGHQGRSCGISQLPGKDVETRLLNGLFAMIHAEPRTKTDVVERLLASMRPVFVAIDKDWAKD